MSLYQKIIISCIAFWQLVNLLHGITSPLKESLGIILLPTIFFLAGVGLSYIASLISKKRIDQ